MNIRKLLPSEAPQLAGHLLRLAPEDRTLRFMGTVDEAGIRRHCERLDWRRCAVIGFFEAGVLRGAAELQVADDRPPVLCELAVTVEKSWQDRGVGTGLLRRGLLIARNRSARAVQLNCFADNYKIQHIVQKFGVPVHHAMGASEAEIPTDPPTYWSLCEELMDDGMGWLTFWSDLALAHLSGADRGASLAANT